MEGPIRDTGAAGGIRTPDPQVRSLMLYPTELRAREGAAILQDAAQRRRLPSRGYFIVGITNWAPSRAEVGQREVTVLSRV